ncbi:hypothetical protein Tco_0991617 [Tanacetum coccineum]|uniref:Uncharacterized protein n=1 Tax=Tanacetum coccineum TaxID=301880 RepID=A0ABQ5EZS3_9ASTR
MDTSSHSFKLAQSSYKNPQFSTTIVSSIYSLSISGLIHPIPQEVTQIDSGLVVPVFKQGDDPIDAINKIFSFLSTVVSSHFLNTNNQLRNSSNLRQQSTIHDGRETVQPVQRRQSSFATSTSGTRANISGT